MDHITSNFADNTAPTELSNESIIEIPYSLLKYLGTEDCNLQNICRICLSVSEPEMFSLFMVKDKGVIINMLATIAELQITDNDGLPSNICKTCQKELIDCYDFKNKCLKSDYTLKSVLIGEFTVSKDTGYNNNINEQNENILVESHEKEEIEEDIKPADIDYLQNIKYSMGDDEALCIVGETKDNKKKFTIMKNNDSNNFQEFILQNDIKKKTKKKHLCTFCPKKFNKLKSLRVHTNKRHAKSTYPFPCDKCTESFHSEFDLGVHGMLHTPGPWTCSQCQKVFHAKPALRRHIQRHMQSKRFRCEVCGKTFVELYALRRHSRVHTGERLEKKYACQLCDKRYSNRSALSGHEALHRGDRAADCSVCGKTFSNARLLASHRRVHSSDKPHVCHHCGKGFRHESTRNTHLRTHTGERPFECALCGKTFIQRSNMTLHMRTHTGEKPYTCSFCDRKFSSGSTLKAHKRTHTGERPYSCKICGKSFARLNLKLHMRLHTGERPHACSACHKRFTSAPRLRDHRRTHTGEKPFECALCTYKFATKSHLIKHVRAHEKRKKSTTKGVVMEPVTVSDKSLHNTNTIVLENKPTEYMFVEQTPSLALNADISSNLCTVQETPLPQTQEILYQDNGDLKAEVIVLGAEHNLITNGVTYVNDLNYSNDMKLVTVNEGEVSLTGNAVVEGTTVKLYQYDQSLLQIHSGAGHLTISRISSKMTTNF